MCGAMGPDQSQSVQEAGGGYSFVRVRSNDVDEHAACLSDWDQTYEQLTPGRFDGLLCEALFAGIQVFRERTSQAVHESGAGRPDSWMFGVPVALQGDGYFGGRPVGVDSLIILNCRGEMDLRLPGSTDLIGVSMPTDRLREYAFEIDERDIDAVFRAVSVVSLPQESMRRLRSFLLLAFESICDHPDRLRHAGARRILEQSIFRSISAALFGHGDDHVMVPGPTRSHALVTRAQEYMRQHVDEPLTIEDLCRELRVSRRTLQYAFQEVLHLNPVAWLRAMRLNGVRRALRSGHDGTTVQDVAACWGFWHLSHFASDYRRMFGELPSETLQRAAGS